MGGHAPGPCLGGASKGLPWALLWAVLAPSDCQGRGGPFPTLWLTVVVAPTVTACPVWVVRGPDGGEARKSPGDLREGAEPQPRELRGVPGAPGVQRPTLRAVVPPPTLMEQGRLSSFQKPCPGRPHREQPQKHFFLKPS